MNNGMKCNIENVSKCDIHQDVTPSAFAFKRGAILFASAEFHASQNSLSELVPFLL